MKHLFRFSLLLLVLILPAAALAYDFEVDGIYYNINGNEATVTFRGSYSSPDDHEYTGAVTIPSTVTYGGITYPVTAIDDNSFYGCRGLTDITIPNSVTTIGWGAFSETAWFDNQPDGLVYAGLVAYKYKGTMPSGTNIIIRDGTPSITDFAFSGCNDLTSVTIPNSVTSIGRSVFDGCNSLANINIPNSVTSISVAAFDGTPWYDNQPDGLVYAGPVAYRYKGTMPSGTNIIIRDGTSGIAGFAFAHCTGLTGITIPSTVTDIGAEAFQSCENLTRIDIPNSVTTIRRYAFGNCTGLTSFTIPNSVTKIDDYVFYQCRGLTSVNIPNSVTAIGDYAFYQCRGLTSVNIPNSATKIGCNAFYECSGLSGVNIPSSVTAIGSSAFWGCTGMASVNIPNSVTKIEDCAFVNCSGLTDLYCYIVDPSAISMGEDVFIRQSMNSSGCRLHVPNGTANAYRANQHWYPHFTQIVEDLQPVQ